MAGEAATARRFIEEILDTGDWSSAGEVLQPDVVMYHPSSPEPIRGLAAVQGFLGVFRAGMPDLTLAGAGRHAGRRPGRGAVGRSRDRTPPRCSASRRPGISIDIRGISFFRFADGKIAEDWVEENTLSRSPAARRRSAARLSTGQAVPRARPPDAACAEHLDLRTTGRHHPHAAGGRAFWLVAFVFLVVLVGTTVPAPLYVIYQSKWGFSAGVLTLVFAIYSAGVLTALLVFGRISDEVGRTRVLGAALAVAIVSTVVFVFATGVPMLMLGRLLSGFAAGLTQGTATAALAEARAAPRRAPRGPRQRHRHHGSGRPRAPTRRRAGGVRGLEDAPRVRRLPRPARARPARAGARAGDGRRPSPARLRLQRIGVPHAIRAPFLSAALAMFSAFAVVGLFVSLVPSFLGHELHRRNHAAAGLVVFVFFTCATVAQVALHRLTSRRAMLVGFGWLLAGLALLMLGLSTENLTVFVVGHGVRGCRRRPRDHGRGRDRQPHRPARAPGRDAVGLLRRRLPRHDDPGDRRRHRLGARRLLRLDARVRDRDRGLARRVPPCGCSPTASPG